MNWSELEDMTKISLIVGTIAFFLVIWAIRLSRKNRKK